LASNPIWETHGIHVGTGKDHIKHGIDDIEAVIEDSISRGVPCITFVIHSPRLTRFRYEKEKKTRVKFVRGHTAYFNYSRMIEGLKKRYGNRIDIRYGVELDWLGSGLGIKWNRSKLFQAWGADFVIGSVHFSPRYGLPYDGSKEESERLIGLCGGVKEFWLNYLEEMIEMVDLAHEMIHVVGHLDLPKRYAEVPESILHPGESADMLSRRLIALLEMIRDYNLVLDLNTSGIRQGCGIYPAEGILAKANELGIPVSIGTDSHYTEEINIGYEEALNILEKTKYRYYVSFNRGIHEKRSLSGEYPELFNVLNLGIEMLNLRFDRNNRLKKPRLSLGGHFAKLKEHFPDASLLGKVDAIALRKERKSIILSDRLPENGGNNNGGEIEGSCLYSHHLDVPGTLSILFNMLASEEINIETARLEPLDDGTAEAYLELTGTRERIEEAVKFVLGTASDRFIEVLPETRRRIPPLRKADVYLLSVDGVDLPLPLSKQMILTIHSNTPGVLLILLSALASVGANVKDLQIGRRGEKQFAVLGIEGDMSEVAEVAGRLGPQFYEVSCMELNL